MVGGNINAMHINLNFFLFFLGEWDMVHNLFKLKTIPCSKKHEVSTFVSLDTDEERGYKNNQTKMYPTEKHSISKWHV